MSTLLCVPDNLFHHHQVTEMGVPAWHKSCQDMKRGVIAYRAGYLVVVPLTDNDTAAHEVRDLRKVGNQRGDRLDAKFRKKFLDID
jgi:hypothetical protein